VGYLDPAKILVVLVIAMIVLGPEKLPRAARQLGAAWRELTRVREKIESEVRSAIPHLEDLDLPRLPRNPGSAVSGFLSDLTRPLASPLRDKADGAKGTDGPAASVPAKGDAERQRSALAFPTAALHAEGIVAPDDPSMN